MFKKVGGFLKAVSAEMRKVTWPSRPEIIRSTLIVLITIIIFAAVIGGIDVLFLQILNIFLR
ncbi:preprotein translocase subunit SecE [Candidatus Aerophobetes bacterium]|uniref:Protein translocase subunit SecE n=1 Tax=Aerophobetes bacterium TaxID=2030807 RepID=A0A523TGQ9_UNCAE|nr:MAG: preprotein translocase subunit SecE [Candidatus Aerophobetes bacterium]